jgi:hypothetical protein
MCVRKSVARHYADLCRTDPLRLKLDRQGDLLSSAGDTDLAHTAFDCRSGIGRFERLRLTHLIPASRLTLEYMERLHQGMGFSSVLIYEIRHPGWHRQKLAEGPSLQRRLGKLKRWLLSSPIERKMAAAYQSGVALGKARLWDRPIPESSTLHSK